MGVPIQNLINEMVNRKENHQQTHWHASRLGNCLRGQYLERIGAEPDEPLDDRVKRIFAVGDLFEGFVINTVASHTGTRIMTQISVLDEERDISGKADLWVSHGGEAELYELKSKHSKSFHYMRKKGKPMEQHALQLWIYLDNLEIEKGNVLYVSKDDLCVEEYPIRRHSEDLREETERRLDLLNKAWEKKDPTILSLPEEDSWQESYCNYHEQCVTLDN